MRASQLFVTGSVGALVAAGLLVLITVDLGHHSLRRRAPGAASPTAASPAAGPVEEPPRPEPAWPALPTCCSSADPVASVLPQRPKPSLALLEVGEVPMELHALDRDLTIPLTAEQVAYLRKALATAVPRDVPSPSYMIRRYPHLQVVAQGPNGEVRLTLNNLQRLADPEYPVDGWSMPPGLWEEVASWLPPETSRPGELAFLLRAAHLVDENRPGFPVVYDAGRAALIARILQQGVPTEEPAGVIWFTHTYVVEGEEYPVQVWLDGFAYAGQHYHLKEAAVMAGATLHAN